MLADAEEVRALDDAAVGLEMEERQRCLAGAADAGRERMLQGFCDCASLEGAGVERKTSFYPCLGFAMAVHSVAANCKWRGSSGDLNLFLLTI